MLLFAALVLQAPVTLGGDAVTEASGLVVSATQPGIFWTHNDSGGTPTLYAFDAAGRPKATVAVTGAKAKDWEDLASGPFPGKKGTWLYPADIGDNKLSRESPCVYAIPEPKIGATESAPAIRLGVRYPDGPHNAECLLCDPRDGRLTIVTKEKSGVSGVYRFPARPMADNLLTKVSTFKVPGISPLVTGGSFRPDGKGVALVTYTHVIEMSGTEFWKSKPHITLQPMLQQLEAVAYARDGRSLWLTSEGEHAPLVKIKAGF